MKSILQKLAKKILHGSATEAEQRFMDAYYDAFDTVTSREDALTMDEHTELRNRIDQGIQARIQRENTVRFRKWIPYAAAALIATSAATWFLVDKETRNKEQGLIATEILPGGNRATLALADGRTIDLSMEQSGIIVAESGILYNNGDSLVDNWQGTIDKDSPSGTEKGNRSMQYAILTTPKGGTYQITLPDGTKVWLNAASTLKYPARFSDEERVVALEGEAYFEVRKSKKQAWPFRVVVTGQTVEVLGTEFNISAYPDESETKTTLVEGKVKVSDGASEATIRSTQYAILSPGQQAITSNAITNVLEVEVEQYTAWKDGFFYFDGVAPQAAFAQLARWYDIDVVYQGKVPTIRFFGMIDRSGNLNDALAILKESGLEFKFSQSGATNQLIIIGE